MDFETLYYINGLANDVLKEYNIYNPIEDMNSVVSKIGGSIVEETEYDDLFDGSVMKTGEASFVIRVSKFDNPIRRRFVLAHELGHLFLHMGFRTNPKLWKNQKTNEFVRFGKTAQEVQANEFAAAMLIKDSKFREEVKDISQYEEVVRLSEYFQVSPSAIINREKAVRALT